TWALFLSGDRGVVSNVSLLPNACNARDRPASHTEIFDGPMALWLPDGIAPQMMQLPCQGQGAVDATRIRLRSAGLRLPNEVESPPCRKGKRRLAYYIKYTTIRFRALCAPFDSFVE